MLGELSADWFIFNVKRLYEKNNLQENVLQERDLRCVLLSYFLKIMTLSCISEKSKWLGGGEKSHHSKTAKNHLKDHDFVWNYDCSLLNSIYHGISYPWYFIPSDYRF